MKRTVPGIVPDRISLMVALFMGSTWSMCFRRLITEGFRYWGVKKIPSQIFLKSVGTWSSSNGSVPHNRAYKITPLLQMSTSGPAYNLGQKSKISQEIIWMNGLHKAIWNSTEHQQRGREQVEIITKYKKNKWKKVNTAREVNSTFQRLLPEQHN